jgi:tetratricopeptide (TPR) repeat protein
MQMSQLNANDKYDNLYSKPKEVVNNREIFFIFIVFVFVFYMIYPEKMLQKQVLSEKSNYELTGVYLENMLRLDPDNTKLMLAAAKVSLERGNLDLCEKLLQVLRKSNDSSVKNSLEKLEFRLIETQIQHSNNPKYIAKKREMLSAIVKRVYEKKLFDKKDALVWYRRAITLSQNKIALNFIKSLSDSNDPKDLEQCVYIMIQPENRYKRIECAEKLSHFDGKYTKKWLVAAWTLYVQERDYKKAIEILERLVKIDSSYKTILAETKYAAGQFVESSKLYMVFYKNSNSYERKKEYLLKAILALSSGKLNSKAVELAQKYEDNYLNDDKMMQKLIKLYLSMSELKAARKLSLKMMKSEK